MSLIEARKLDEPKLMPRIWKFIILILANIIMIAILLYGFEYYLRITDPFPDLPFDTGYYNSNRVCYSDLSVPAEGVFTWGHLVKYNRFGFRERDFVVPKPIGVCRIMVLGDSFTWGAGLATEERYSNLVEKYLSQAFPDREFEVLNFAPPGASTVEERNILQDYKEIVAPDLIVIGFVVNDPQPKAENYRIEKEQFDAKYGRWFDAGAQTMIAIGLPQMARITRIAADNLLVNLGIIPPWEVGLMRIYDKDSTEWGEFKQALQDIKRMSDEMNLPSPVFAVLNNRIFPDSIQQKWYRQAEQTASELGFRAYNHEQDFMEQLIPGDIPVNALDSHPSAKVNLIYAQKLFGVIASDITNSKQCDSISLQGALPSTAAVLSTKRLMSVRLGDSVRFLGYEVDQTKMKEEIVLHVAFGWEALQKIDTDYTVFVHLLDDTGQKLAQSDTLPCHGGCPTTYWTPGMLSAPAGFSKIHWSSDRWLPVRILPYTSSLLDEHTIAVSAQMPPGEYALVMGMYDATTGERLSAYDEITETWLPEAQIVLGKITIP